MSFIVPPQSGHSSASTANTFAGVLEASVVGRTHPEWGEEVVAFVVRGGATVTEHELDELCLGAIARFKRPRRYVFEEGLPKNNYGNVLKTELRERLARGC